MSSAPTTSGTMTPIIGTYCPFSAGSSRTGFGRDVDYGPRWLRPSPDLTGRLPSAIYASRSSIFNGLGRVIQHGIGRSDRSGTPMSPQLILDVRQLRQPVVQSQSQPLKISVAGPDVAFDRRNLPTAALDSDARSACCGRLRCGFPSCVLAGISGKCDVFQAFCGGVPNRSGGSS